MSNYTASSTVYQGSLTVLRAILPELDAQAQAISEGLSSARLFNLAADLRQAEALGTTEALTLALRQARQTMPMWSTSPIPDTALLDALEQAAGRFAGYEWQLTAAAAGLALGDLGYTVSRADGDRVTGFEASRDHEKLLVQVSNGGKVVTDHVGLSAAAECGASQQDFVERLAAYGVALTEQERHDHRDPRGGGLALRSARAGGRNAAERIVTSFGRAGEVDRKQQRRSARKELS